MLNKIHYYIRSFTQSNAQFKKDFEKKKKKRDFNIHSKQGRWDGGECKFSIIIEKILKSYYSAVYLSKYLKSRENKKVAGL